MTENTDLVIKIDGDEIRDPENAEDFREVRSLTSEQIDDSIAQSSVDFIDSVWSRRHRTTPPSKSNSDQSKPTDENVNASMAPPEQIIGMIEMGLELSEPVTIGVVANYLCDKLREHNVTTFKISCLTGSNGHETKEIDVDDESQLKSVLDEAHDEVTDDAQDEVSCPIDWCSYSGDIQQVIGHVTASDDHTQPDQPRIECPVKSCNKNQASFETISGHLLAISDGEHTPEKLLETGVF